jgi:putative PEP-CTERM system histidine kinase
MTVSLGILSYGLAAGAFLMLTLLLLTSWEGRSQGARLIAACWVTAVWATNFALGAQYVEISTPLVQLTEFLRYGAWFVVLTGLTRQAGVARPLSALVHFVWGGGALLTLAAPYLIRAGVPLPAPERMQVNAGLVMSLLGLILLEQVYRNAREGGRYALKFFIIAVGVMFAYDLFLYSQAELIHNVEPASWDARGFVFTLMVPLLAIAARRNPQWSLNVFVSRHVVFYTTSFVVVGGYLLMMALGGYAIRLYGGTWGRAAQLVFFAGAGVMLLALVASGSMRRRLRVFLNKHFYRNKYDYRVEWLRFIQTLSTPEQGVDTRDNSVRAIAQIIGSPGGVLYLRNEDRDQYKVAASWPPGEFTESRSYPQLPATDELVSFLHRHQWVVDLREQRETPDVYQNLSLPAFLADGRERYQLIIPLAHGDELIGLLLLVSPPEPFKPNYEDRDLLKTVGRHVAVHLAQFEADRRLAESRQFEAYHRLTAFVMHDLKNLAAQLALIVSNAEKHKHNPAFVDDAISTIANSTERMQRLIQQLQRRELQSLSRRISISAVARNAAERCAERAPVPTCIGADDDVWVEADPERLTMIVEHVIRNAQDACGDDGCVCVIVDAEGGNENAVAQPTETATQVTVPVATLTVVDDGAGMSAEFVRERLFKPFDTTKGSKGMGIGAYQVREYVRTIGGRVDVASVEGQGTRITLRVPLSGPPQRLPADVDAPSAAPT